MMLERYQKKGVDLAKLLTFVAVAEELSFRGASERLRQAQPAVSRQVRGLEAALGCRLFHRDRRGTQLTSAGEELLESLPSAFEGLEVALQRARAASEGHRGRLRVGCSPSSINTYLPSILRRYRERFPDVKVEIEEGNSMDLLDATGSGRLDCCFILSVEPTKTEGLKSKVVLIEPIGVVLPVWHDATKREAVRVSDLVDLPFIQFPRERNPRLYDTLATFFDRGGSRPVEGLTIGSRLQAVGRVGAGMGFTTLTHSFSFLCGSSAVFRPIAGKRVPKVSHRFYRSGESVNSALAYFEKAVEEEAESLRSSKE